MQLVIHKLFINSFPIQLLVNWSSKYLLFIIIIIIIIVVVIIMS